MVFTEKFYSKVFMLCIYTVHFKMVKLNIWKNLEINALERKHTIFWIVI